MTPPCVCRTTDLDGREERFDAGDASPGGSNEIHREMSMEKQKGEQLFDAHPRRAEVRVVPCTDAAPCLMAPRQSVLNWTRLF